MSEAAFTKGPWVVPLDYGRILGAHGEPLFYIEDYGSAERLAADVALIAAAPSLYEALEGFLCRECKGQGTVEYDTGGEDWGRHGWNACSQCDGTGTEPFATNDCGAAIIARAALALARGER